MLDAMVPGAAVFEPEEVDVLSAACGLAIKKINKAGQDDAEIRSEVARLVHNLGRSRLRHKKKLKDATDAASLAEEAVDLLGYLHEGAQVEVASPAVKPMPSRAVPIFPAEFRMPPSTTLKPRPLESCCRSHRRKPARPSRARRLKGRR